MPYENITGLQDLKSEPRLKIAIVGEPKAGKSWFGLTAPGPIWHCDFDGRSESVKEFVSKNKRDDIDCKSYIDTNYNTPTAIQSLEQDISMFEYLDTQGKAIPATFILDSITFMRAACEHELIKQHPKFAREVKLGATVLKIPSGWDIINGNRGYIEYIIGRLSSLGNVIAIFHEMDEKDVQTSTKDEKKYTGRKTIQPQYLATVLSMFNDVFRITVNYDGTRTATVQANSEFMASTSMRLDAQEPPDIMKMLEKHKKAVGIP